MTLQLQDTFCGNVAYGTINKVRKSYYIRGLFCNIQFRIISYFLLPKIGDMIKHTHTASTLQLAAIKRVEVFQKRVPGIYFVVHLKTTSVGQAIQRRNR
jgi:hypothetical protein